VPAITRGRGATVAGCVSGEWRKRNEFCPPHPLHPSRRYRGRCDARFPPGKKSIAIRKLAPPNDAIYTSRPLLRLFLAAPASREFRGIPRLVTGGGDRVRFAISPANTPRATRQPLSSPRTHRRHRRGPETFGGGIEGVRCIKCIERGSPFASSITGRRRGGYLSAGTR